MSARTLAARLEACGLRVSVWRDKRVYLHGYYGRDIRAYVEPLADQSNADGAHIVVESNWRSPQQSLRCKSVKHAILSDLYTAGVLSSPPPADWRAVTLEERPRTAPLLASASARAEEEFVWPKFTVAE